MTMDTIISLLVAVTLVEMMVTIGLDVAFVELLEIAKNWRLVTMAAIANYLVVPAITIGLLLIFQATPMVVAGFLILAVCPGAPFGPPCTAIAKGNVAASVGLMVILAGSSALVAPVLLSFLLPLIGGNDTPTINPLKIVGTLLGLQLVPLSIGLLVRYFGPKLAARLKKPADILNLVLNLVLTATILVAQFQLLMAIPLRGFVGMLALLAGCLAAGWLLGGPGQDNRKALTVTTSLRNVGVGLAIASGSFPGTQAVTAVSVYGLIEIAGSVLVALALGRLASSRTVEPTVAKS